MSDSYVSGGVVFDTVVNGGSSLYVLLSGDVVSSKVESGGALYAYEGGYAQNSTIQSGGFFEVASGGFAETSAISASAFLDVAYSGFANFTDVFSGGDAYVASGGFVLNTDLEGLMVVSGFSSFTTVRSGGAELLYGRDQAATVDNGGLLLVASSGASSYAVVSSGGTLIINPAGSATYVEVHSGAFIVAGPQSTFAAFGITSGAALIEAGGSDVSLATNLGGEVISSGVAVHDVATNSLSTTSGLIGTTISGFKNAYVLAGGEVNNSLIDALASVTVYSGGSAVGNTVEGVITAYSGATVSDTSIVGGIAYVSGATLAATTIGSGGGNYGFLNLMDGATSGSKVYAGGDEVIYGGTGHYTAINAGGEQDVFSGGTAAGAVILSGGIEFAVSGGVASATTIAGGALDLVSGGRAYGGIDFTTGNGILFIDSTDLPTTTISGFGVGDSIELTDLTYSSSDAVTVGTPGIVTISVGGTDYDLHVAGAAANTPYYLIVGATDSGLVLLDEANAPCFAAGTRILTPRGDIAVEKLAVGDSVITKAGEDVAILWIGNRRIDLTRHPHPEQVRPIRIAAGSLGEGVPCRDLLLSPDHALFIGGALIPAKALLNDRNIRQLTPKTVTYFHIELAEHNIIFAENCAVETYLETGNRGAFTNAAGALTLHPDFAQSLREQKSCAPFTDSGPILEAARERTMRRHYETRAGKGSSAFL